MKCLFYLSSHLKVLKMDYGSTLSLLFYIAPHLIVLKVFLLQFQPQNSVLPFTSFKRAKSFQITVPKFALMDPPSYQGRDCSPDTQDHQVSLYLGKKYDNKITRAPLIEWKDQSEATVSALFNYIDITSYKYLDTLYSLADFILKISHSQNLLIHRILLQQQQYQYQQQQQIEQQRSYGSNYDLI